MRGVLLSAVSESFMLSVEIEFDPLELVFDEIVIRSWCEGESIFDFRFSIFDWDRAIYFRFSTFDFRWRVGDWGIQLEI